MKHDHGFYVPADQKTLKQYWVGYTSDTRGTELRTLLHPDWIRDAYFEEQGNNGLEQVKIFDTRFIEECMQRNANSAVQLTNAQKRSLGQTAFDCGYHPKQRVKMIRYKVPEDSTIQTQQNQ